ncbi:hypothetical protein [Microbacterium sp. NC79]|uniref:hypothetical protein n=1 Tax=Microbacterium sp. NC79 TaxID=2851009 RepID=UPI001C2CA273|nr:hypothetical protein [Microbacterium sp. NC79]MBV0896063.1 hypothetical protein [Microbacterium sp. NC79]
MSEMPHVRQYDESVGLPFDPLRLCVFATIAAIAALTGPIAVLVFALVAIGGYRRARAAGLLRSRCKLGDTRLVLTYLVALAVVAAAAIPFWVWGVVNLVSGWFS